jgi:hypothetical protein
MVIAINQARDLPSRVRPRRGVQRGDALAKRRVDGRGDISKFRSREWVWAFSRDAAISRQLMPLVFCGGIVRDVADCANKSRN